MRPGNGLRRNGRALYACKAICLSLSILRHDTYFWTTGSRTLYDKQHRNKRIYAHHSHRITQWNQTILNPLELEKYSEVVFNKGAPLSNCFGFVDGTVRPISRPGENQRLLYNGHKRVHGLKFQSLVLPNGLIAHLYGPVGKPHC